MKLVQTREEAQHLLKCFQHPHFANVKNYITVVETDPEWVRQILPAPLEPTEPIVSFAMSEGDQFHGLVTGVNCRFGDIHGSFGIAYMMDTDLACIFGREGLGEPKKLGITSTAVKDGVFTGSVSRFGQELVHVEAKVIGPGKESMVDPVMHNFHFKYAIKADGTGLTDIDLIDSRFDNKVTDVTLMEPTKFELTASPMDVYGEIPVKKVVGCLSAMFDMTGSAEYLAKVDEEGFLPYAFYKHDDYRLTMDVQ